MLENVHYNRFQEREGGRERERGRDTETDRQRERERERYFKVSAMARCLARYILLIPKTHCPTWSFI